MLYGRLEFDPWVGKFPWRREWQPTLVFLPGDLHAPRMTEELDGVTVHGVAELDTQLSN